MKRLRLLILNQSAGCQKHLHFTEYHWLALSRMNTLDQCDNGCRKPKGDKVVLKVVLKVISKKKKISWLLRKLSQQNRTCAQAERWDSTDFCKMQSSLRFLFQQPQEELCNFHSYSMLFYRLTPKRNGFKMDKNIITNVWVAIPTCLQQILARNLSKVVLRLKT